MEDLNTCPHCGATPVRFTPPALFGRGRVECATRDCELWSPDYAHHLSQPRPNGAPGRVMSRGLLPPGPGPEVFFWGFPEPEEDDAATSHPWVVRHHDFGDA